MCDSFASALLHLGVEVFAYILARDWNHFLDSQEILLLRIMECIESAGVQIALPSQAIFLTTASSNDGRVEGLLNALAPDKETSDRVRIPDDADQRSGMMSITIPG
jgi:MscS family membrane protein